MTEVVDGYVSRDLPLNVVVLDMEWHSMLDPATCKEFIGKKGWGGMRSQPSHHRCQASVWHA